MKKIIIKLMLAGLFPASIFAQTSTPSSLTSQVSSTPPCRARTLDLRATPGTENNAAITMDANSFVNLGQPSSFWSAYGLNNLEMFTGLSSSTSQPTSGNAFILFGVGSTASALGNIDFNYWNTSVDPINGNGGLTTSQNWIHLSTVVNAENITYTLASTSNTLGGQVTITGTCFSSDKSLTKKNKSSKPQSIPLDSSSQCDTLYNDIDLAQEKYGWAAAYDSNQYFVEHCYTNRFATAGLTGSNTMVQNGALGSPPVCWEQNLQWLLSVLPLRRDAQWFCADVAAIMGSLDSEPDTTYQQKNTETNRGMSVLYWLIHNPACTNEPDSQLYVNSRGSQYETYLNYPGLDRDTVPFDTTIYTMQELGLDSVLKYAGLLGVNEGNQPNIITNATAYPNPTGVGTVLSFGVSREAYVTIGLFDILGHQVTAPGFGGVVESGNLSVPLTLQGLPSGTYFGRIMTTFGEVQTVKIVKE